MVVGFGWRLVPTVPSANMAGHAQSRSCRAYTCPTCTLAHLGFVEADAIDMATRRTLARRHGDVNDPL